MKGVALIAAAWLLAGGVALAQNTEQTGTGGVIGSLDAVEKSFDELWDGTTGQIVRGAVGAAGLGASLKFGSAAAVGSIIEDGFAVQGNINAPGPTSTGSSSTESSTSTTTATSTN